MRSLAAASWVIATTAFVTACRADLSLYPPVPEVPIVPEVVVTAPDTTQPADVPPPIHTESFLRGERTLALTQSYSFGDSETFYTTTVTGGYFIRDQIAINFGLAGHFVNTDYRDTLGLEFNIIPRWHFYVDDRWSAFIELGAGVAFFDHNLTPPDGTHFNFTPQGGMGLTYKLEEGMQLLGGVRWQHISNGGFHGADRHTASNTAVAFLGVMWEF